MHTGVGSCKCTGDVQVPAEEMKRPAQLHVYFMASSSSLNYKYMLSGYKHPNWPGDTDPTGETQNPQDCK